MSARRYGPGRGAIVNTCGLSFLVSGLVELLWVVGLPRARAGQDLPWLMVAIAHHLAPAVLIPLAREPGNVGVHLGLQRLGQHLRGALADDLIDQRRRAILAAVMA